MLISKRSRGFTVLEVLIALGILSSFSPIITSSINYVIKSDQKYEVIKHGMFFLESVAKDFKYNVSDEELILLKGKFGEEFYVNLKSVALEEHTEQNILNLIQGNIKDYNNFIKVTLKDKKINVLVKINDRFNQFNEFVEFEREVY